MPITFGLSGIGIAFVTRLAPDLAVSQIIWLFVGIACMVITLAVVRNIDRLSQYKYTFMVLGIILLLSPMIPGLGQEILGSRIWLKLGPFSFQPGEIAKICIVIFLASYLAQNREMLSIFTVRVGRFRVPDLGTLAPLLVMWAISFIIVVFEKDLGSALVCFVLFLVMLYIASGKKLYLVVGFGLAAIGCVFLYQFFGHVQIRVNTWLDPFSDASGNGYQLCQTLYSLADGGMVGVGIGNGLAENIPVVESDFIFAAIAEETGLLGGAAVLLLYLSLCIRGFATAARAKSDVSAMMAVGCTVTIVLQAFIIVGGVTRLIPLTGLTLPFISQGGSSLLASFIGIGLLLRCGDEGTGINSEVRDGTSRMAPIGAHGSHGRPAETGVLGRVALGKRLTNTALAFALMFAALVANLTYVMVFMADEYQSYPGNNHTLYKEARTERGSISTYDGVVLADSVQADDGGYTREYPQGSLAAHLVGYYSQVYGASGIEASQNNALKGDSNFASWTDVVNSMAGIETPGNDVRLTINSEIQKTAESVLEGYKGAVVVMNPKTGAVLACASSPTYDNTNIDALLQSGGGEDGSMYDRAMDALYTPGSTFKVVTLSAALETGTASLTSTYQAPGSMDIGNAPVTNDANESYGTISLQQAFAVSSNVVFGQVANEVGASSLVQFANAFGYGQKLGQDLTTTASIMADPSLMTEWETAWAGAGQPVGMDHTPGPQTTVMQNCVIAAAIANSGVVMDPFFVSQILAPDGTVVKTTQSRSLGQAVSSATADQVKQAMLAVVQSGTGTDAQIPGVKVAGKTGSAETGGTNVNSMFVGFAPYDSPTVAISVALEDYDKHDVEAAKIAGIVLTAALAAQGA